MSDRHERKRAAIAANLEVHHGLSHFQARLVAEHQRDAAP
jgi:hypothetical protein